MRLTKKIFLQYSKIPEPVKASVWFTICNIIQKGIALITTPIFTRIMTTQQYGQYSVYQSWYSIVAIFATLNLYAGVYNNGMIKWPEKRKQFTSAMQGLSTSLTVLLFVIYLLAMNWWNSLLGMSSVFVLAMFAELLFVPAYNFWAAGQRFDYKYKKLVVITVGMGILSPIVGVLAVLTTDYKAEARVLSFVFVQVCVGLLFYIYNMRQGRVFLKTKYWKFALAFNLPLIPHYLAQTVLGQADRIMIQRMIGETEAALYSVAYSISMMFNIVTNAINNSFIPYTYKALRERKYVRLRENANFLVTMIASACVIATAFAPEIISIFASAEYYDAHNAVPPIAISLLFIFITSLFGNIEFYYEKTKFIMIASSVAAITNIALNYYAIPTWGYVAAAYTTLICYILLAFAHYIMYSILLRKNKGEEDLSTSVYDVKYIAKVSVASIGMMFFLTVIYENTILRYFVLGLILLVIFIKRRKIVECLNELKRSDG